MNWTLEVVVVPVADIDRAKAFYADELGSADDNDGWAVQQISARV